MTITTGKRLNVAPSSDVVARTIAMVRSLGEAILSPFFTGSEGGGDDDDGEKKPHGPPRGKTSRSAGSQRGGERVWKNWIKQQRLGHRARFGSGWGLKGTVISIAASVLFLRFVYEFMWVLSEERVKTRDALFTMRRCDEWKLQGKLDTVMLIDTCKNAEAFLSRGTFMHVAGRAASNIWPCPSSDPLCVHGLVSGWWASGSWIIGAVLAFAAVTYMAILVARGLMGLSPLPGFLFRTGAARCAAHGSDPFGGYSHRTAGYYYPQYYQHQPRRFGLPAPIITKDPEREEGEDEEDPWVNE